MKIHHFQFYEISTRFLPDNRMARGYENIHSFGKAQFRKKIYIFVSDISIFTSKMTIFQNPFYVLDPKNPEKTTFPLINIHYNYQNYPLRTKNYLKLTH